MEIASNFTAEELIEQAHLALIRHQPEMARSCLQRALESEPGNAAAQQMLSQLSPSAVQTPQQSTPGMIALVLSGAIFSSPLRAFTICLALVMLVLIIVGFAMTVPVPPGAVNDPNFVKDAVLVAGVIGPWLSATACLVCGKIPRGWFSYNTIESNPVDFWTRVYFMYAIAGFFLYIALFVH